MSAGERAHPWGRAQGLPASSPMQSGSPMRPPSPVARRHMGMPQGATGAARPSSPGPRHSTPGPRHSTPRPRDSISSLPGRRDICIYIYIYIYIITNCSLPSLIFNDPPPIFTVDFQSSRPWTNHTFPRGDAAPCSVLQCVGLCCSVLQCVVVCCGVLQCVQVRCSTRVCI